MINVQAFLDYLGEVHLRRPHPTDPTQDDLYSTYEVTWEDYDGTTGIPVLIMNITTDTEIDDEVAIPAYEASTYYVAV